ncbi:uncharacterized protein LOC132722318 isoform X2 [Ruditapes philippinarum]|uniref:uncharacterized protein LOC132722318 isoform X2 n=1 Tax=Ruditapes philippinarum TaxID=129788 RepID=UPI00295BFF8B|nr:uncharacterized protein LOC132722318 isoform X2 [Ruditapes philippinarum]
MSLRTKINGFTAWVNLRLTPYNQLLNNVLMDLLTGTHMKYLLESFTGSHLKGLENLDGLTDQQKQTRIDWVVEELKKKNVIAEDVFVDTRLFAMRSADHVFNLLWRLISHDIWFVWERAEFLQVDDPDILTQVHFTWTPEPPPKKKKSKSKQKKSLLSGFGASITTDEKPEKPDDKRRGTQICWNFGAGERNPVKPMNINVKSSAEEELKQSSSLTSSDPQGESACYMDKDYLAENQLDTEAKEDINDSQDNEISRVCNEVSERDMTRYSDDIKFTYTQKDDTNIEKDDLDTQTDDNSDQSELDSKPLVSIFMVPLKDPDDSDEDMTTFSGRYSPWLLEELDSDEDDTANDSVLEILQERSNSAAADNTGNVIVDDDRPDKTKLDLDTEIKARQNAIAEEKECISMIKVENNTQFTKDEHLTMEFKQVNKEESKNSNPKETSPDNHVENHKPSRMTKTKSHRKGKRSSSRGRRNSLKKITVMHLEENNCQKETKSVTFEDEEDLISNVNKNHQETVVEEVNQAESDDDEKWIKFPNAEYMKGFKKKQRNPDDYPPPEDCILEMINYQLKVTRDGKGLFCYSIDDFVDSRVLCALVNSFVPNTFTADLLLNDRWTINLALKTAEKMFYAETPFAAEDLVEAEPMAVCAYFAFFLMVAYRYRQTTAVVNRVDFINMLIRECNHELEKFPPIISNMQELQRRKDIKQQLDRHRQAIENLEKKYDVDFCRKWVQHVEHVQNELRREIRDKMRERFETVEVPRNITINDFCLAAVINLSLSNGCGFYLSTAKENLSEGRRLVLRRKENGEFIEDFTNKSKTSIKDALHIHEIPGQVLEVNPEDYPDFEFYFEAQSRNKQLKTGSFFLYQVFPGNTSTWQRLFIKSARDCEYETVEKMIGFFREDSSFINCREPKTGNTALHLACRMGHFDIVRLLLENGANFDIKNNFRCAPINLAIESLQRKICHYLIEWGCDVHSKNVKGQTVLETIKNDDFKRNLMELYDFYSDCVPKIMGGDMNLLDQVVADHASGAQEFCCLRSRVINGSTLLHTAAYYGHIPAIKELLSLRVDINIRDYKGATPLHRAKSPEIMELLLEAGAHVNAEDSESNTPLHVKCYGETGKPSDIECIQMLLNKNVSLNIRNSRGLMPIHCCVMQGRIDVMQLLMNHDKNNAIATALSKENDKKPPSLLHLALANDFPDCAEWLLANGFQFKEKEQDILMRRILTEQIKLEKRAEAIKFLLDNGAEPSPKYPGGNSALHYAASLSGTSDVLELLVMYKAEIDAVNEDGCTPLFFATQSNNKFAACVLIEQGANVRQKNTQGLTAFDYIIDFEDWIECGYFNEEVKARLKAYNLKHARDLIRAISKRVKPGPLPMIRHDLMSKSTFSMQASHGTTHYRTGTSMSRHKMLPPVSGGATPKYLMF